MNIETKINSDFIIAFKTKDFARKNVLAVVRGEMQNLKKNLMVDVLDDEKTITVLMKFIKGIRSNITMASVPNPDHVYELGILESYLPVEMSEDDIRAKIIELIEAGASNIGQIMRVFVTLYVDRQKVSTIYKELSN